MHLYFRPTQQVKLKSIFNYFELLENVIDDDECVTYSRQVCLFVIDPCLLSFVSHSVYLIFIWHSARIGDDRKTVADHQRLGGKLSTPVSHSRS